MECPLESGRTNIQATGIFVAYSARTLPAQAELDLEKHLASCSACRSMAAAQRQVWAALDAWTPAPVNADFDAKLYSRIAVDRVVPWWKRGWALNTSWKPAMPVAAACAALLAAFLIKSPVTGDLPHASLQPRIDIEQVERALDDIDMLKQMGVAAPSQPVQPNRSRNL